MSRGVTERRRIYLMRHGHVSYTNEEGQLVDPKLVVLTKEGIAQVELVRDLLKDIRLDHVICSGLPRTEQTAQIVSSPHGVDIAHNAGFHEINGGYMSDVPIESRKEAYVYALETAAEPNAKFGSGECFEDFEKRIIPTFDRAIAETHWSTMLLVCHDVVNRVILAHIIGAGLNSLAALEQDMACINVIDIEVLDGVVVRRRVKALNVTPYNVEKSGMHKTSFENVFTGIIDF